MVPDNLIRTFTDKLKKYDEELEDYKKENKIEIPIYQKYCSAVWIVPPYSKEEGLYIQTDTPKFISDKYIELYNQSVLELSE